MGANLTSPPNSQHGQRPPTSVCNHLFSPGDGGPMFAPKPAKESVLMQGWNWGKRNIQPVVARRTFTSRLSESRSTTTSTSTTTTTTTSKSSDAISSFTNPRDQTFSKLTVTLDNNSNYRKYHFKYEPETTVIPNYHTIREDLKRDSKKQDFVNNNSVTPSSPVSPVHSRNTSCQLIDNRSIREQPFPKKKTIIQASTSELLRGLGIFIAKHCAVINFDPAHVIMWFRGVDRALLLQGWQDIAFVNPANLVFVFMILRDLLPEESTRLDSMEEVHAYILTCLYVSYSYMGNEISYPLKPFIIETNREVFWSRCISIITSHSEKMLLLNSSSSFFTEVFADLKRYSD